MFLFHLQFWGMETSAPRQTHARNKEDIPRIDVSGVEKTLLAQGAEARVWEGVIEGKKYILKERFQKLYRHPTLDNNIRKQRTGKEARSLLKLEASGIPTAHVIGIDQKSYTIVETKIEGVTLRDELIRLQSEQGNMDVPFESIKLCGLVGDIVAKMHDLKMIHGDLTTSNFIVVRDPEKPEKLIVHIIDLGLVGSSTKAEDKAVDLYVLEKALEATHPNAQQLFSAVLNAYRECPPGKREETINRFKVVRLRGRKRTDKE